MKSIKLTLAALTLLAVSAPAFATEEALPPGILAQAASEMERDAAQSRESQAAPVKQTGRIKSQSHDGKMNAQGKPTILEFGDLQCPDSAAFATGARQRLRSEFIASGQADYKFHDFPLDSHPLAAQAAALARCAGPNADRVRDQLLQSQGTWRSEQDLAAQAVSAGLSPQAAQQCLASGSSHAAVQKDRAMGQSMGVRATPTLVLGYTDSAGKFTPVKNVRGDQPYQVVRSAVQELVNGSGAEATQGRKGN